MNPSIFHKSTDYSQDVIFSKENDSNSPYLDYKIEKGASILPTNEKQYLLDFACQTEDARVFLENSWDKITEPHILENAQQYYRLYRSLSDQLEVMLIREEPLEEKVVVKLGDTEIWVDAETHRANIVLQFFMIGHIIIKLAKNLESLNKLDVDDLFYYEFHLFNK